MVQCSVQCSECRSGHVPTMLRLPIEGTGEPLACLGGREGFLEEEEMVDLRANNGLTSLLVVGSTPAQAFTF